MSIPKGYKLPHLYPNTMVCKVNKSFYVLKHARKQWYSKLSYTLLSRVHNHSTANYSLFTKSINNNFITLLL